MLILIVSGLISTLDVRYSGIAAPYIMGWGVFLTKFPHLSLLKDFCRRS